MTDVRAASTVDGARWLRDAEVDWSDLVRYGPPGFETYVRISFEPDASESGTEADAVRSALTRLESYTMTPDHAYAAIWEGWGSDQPAPRAPLLKIPNRTMLLFEGPVRKMRDAAAWAWHGSAAASGQEPHLVWPEDRAWCLACDVDEEVEFTVGCSDEAALALARSLPVAVRRVTYGDPAPMYRGVP